MATSATIPAYQKINTGAAAQLANSDGTSEKTVFSFGSPNGGICDELRCYSGPTTAPGGTQNIVIKFYQGTSTAARIIAVFPLINTVDTEQFVLNLGNLKGNDGDQIKVQLRTALASGATLDFYAIGRDL